MNSPSLLTSALTCYLEACAKSRLDSPVCVFQLMHPLQTGPSLAATVAFVKYLAFFSFSQKVWSNTDEMMSDIVTLIRCTVAPNKVSSLVEMYVYAAVVIG